MNDTELLDWMHVHVSCVDRVSDDIVELTWRDTKGDVQTTTGVDLRDCVRGAIAEMENSKLLQKLKWTKETPTKPGWYWSRRALSQDDCSPIIVHLRVYEGKMRIGNWEIQDNTEWAGPIDLPID